MRMYFMQLSEKCTEINYLFLVNLYNHIFFQIWKVSEKSMGDTKTAFEKKKNVNRNKGPTCGDIKMLVFNY